MHCEVIVYTKAVFHGDEAAAWHTIRTQDNQVKKGRHQLKAKYLMKLCKKKGQALSKETHTAKLILNPLQQRISSLLQIKF